MAMKSLVITVWIYSLTIHLNDEGADICDDINSDNECSGIMLLQ